MKSRGNSFSIYDNMDFPTYEYQPYPRMIYKNDQLPPGVNGDGNQCKHDGKSVTVQNADEEKAQFAAWDREDAQERQAAQAKVEAELREQADLRDRERARLEREYQLEVWAKAKEKDDQEKAQAAAKEKEDEKLAAKTPQPTSPTVAAVASAPATPPKA